MHLTFQSIRIKRFRSYLDEVTLSFVDAGPGLYFLKGKNKTDALGSNGAGKSTVMDALLWCLYGQTIQGLKNPDVIPWTGKGTTEVEVTIQFDKKIHTIKRTISPNKLSIDDNEAGQDYVDKLIGIPFEILPYTVILGQRQPLFFDLKPSESLNLFSEVLHLDRWEERSEHAAKLCKSLQAEIDLSIAEAGILEREKEVNTLNYDKLKQQSEIWEGQREQRLRDLENTKTILQRDIELAIKRVDNSTLKLDRALMELKAIEPSLEKLRAKERPLITKAANLARDKQQAIDTKKQLDEMLDSLDDECCPTCSQPLKSEKQRKQLTENIRAQIEALKLQQLLKELEAATAELNKVEIAREAEQAAKQKFENDVREAYEDLDIWRPKLGGWQATVRQLDQSAAESLETANPYTEQLRTTKQRRDQLKTLLETTNKSIVSKGEYHDRVKFWIKGFKDIKLYSIEEILQELEITSNSMCEEFGLVGWQIKYDIERETKAGTVARGLNIVILSPHNSKPVRWKSWSGGESQRLRLIGTAALSSVLLNHVGITTNLEIYDEPTESLSKEGIQDLVEMLAERAKVTKKNVWLIDQHVIESTKFVQTVLATKSKSGSMLAIV